MIQVDLALVGPGPHPATAPHDAAADARALIAEQLAVLSRLTAIGMEIAEAVGREAVRGADAAESAEQPLAQRRDPGLAFARVARAVRMTIALQSRLMKDLADLHRADEQAERNRRYDRRKRLHRLMDEAARASIEARRDAGDDDLPEDEDALEEEIEQLTTEAYERLVDAEDDDLDGRSVADVLAAICGDLGLSPDWTARLCTAVGAPPPEDDEDDDDVAVVWADAAYDPARRRATPPGVVTVRWMNSDDVAPTPPPAPS